MKLKVFQKHRRENNASSIKWLSMRRPVSFWIRSLKSWNETKSFRATLKFYALVLLFLRLNNFTIFFAESGRNIFASNESYLTTIIREPVDEPKETNFWRKTKIKSRKHKKVSSLFFTVWCVFVFKLFIP